MSENRRGIGSDLAKVDAHVITQEEYDEIPELTEEDFERAVWTRNGVPIPAPPRRGRPPTERPKIHTRLRIDPDVLEHFKAGGPGWQTRINAALRETMGRST